MTCTRRMHAGASPSALSSKPTVPGCGVLQVGGPTGPCEDKDVNCDAWAASGECEKNPGGGAWQRAWEVMLSAQLCPPHPHCPPGPGRARCSLRRSWSLGPTSQLPAVPPGLPATGWPVSVCSSEVC